MILGDFKPRDIIEGGFSKSRPEYAIILHDSGNNSSYFINLVLRSVVGLSKADAENKALEVLREGSTVVKKAPLEQAEVIASLLTNRADLTVSIEKL